MAEKSETTDLTLFVRTSGEEIILWDRRRIVDALVREADIDDQLAEQISKEVEKQIEGNGSFVQLSPVGSPGMIIRYANGISLELPANTPLHIVRQLINF